MTPELRQSIAQRARELQARIRPGDGDVVALAKDARRLFEEAADDLRARWLVLELAGYEGHAGARSPVTMGPQAAPSPGAPGARPLSEVLRVGSEDLVGRRLVAHIAAYRTQHGYDVTPGHSRREHRHFFVEPLAELVEIAGKLAPTRPAVVLAFPPAPDALSVEFRGEVFARILDGFRAALHLQLGDVTR